MPLPSVINGAKQCEVLSKRTRLRCQNPAAYGCRACRMHGAHESRKSPQGASHPQYKNGNETKESRLERSHMSAVFLYLRDIGDTINLFIGPKTRGRRPNQYVKLDLSDPEQMNLAIVLSMRKEKK